LSLAASTPVEKAAGDGVAARMLAFACTVCVCAGFVAYMLLWEYKYVYLGFLAAAFASVLFAAGRGVRTDGLGAALLPVATLFGYLALSLLWSMDPPVASEAYVNNLIQLVVLAVFFVIGRNASPLDANRFFVLYTLTCLAMVVYVYAVQGGFEGEEFGSIRSSFGMILATSVPFLVWWIHDRPQLRRWWLLLFVLFTVIVLRSRAAFLMGPVAFLVSQYFLGTRSLGQKVAWTVAAVISVIALALFAVAEADLVRLSANTFSLDVSPEVERELSLEGDHRVDVQRRLMTFSVIEDITEHPLLGTGYLGTYVTTSWKYGVAISAHGLLPLLAEAGVAGFALFLWALLAFWRWTRPTGPYASYFITLRLGMLAFLGIGMFHPVLESPMFYIVYGLGLGMGHQWRADSRLIPKVVDTSPRSKLVPVGRPG
jgi:hypothetical protein